MHALSLTPPIAHTLICTLSDTRYKHTNIHRADMRRHLALWGHHRYLALSAATSCEPCLAVGQRLTDPGAYSLWRSSLAAKEPSRETTSKVYIQAHSLEVAMRILHVRKRARWTEGAGARDAHIILQLNVGALRQQRPNNLQVAAVRGDVEWRPSVLRRRRENCDQRLPSPSVLPLGAAQDHPISHPSGGGRPRRAGAECQSHP
jgi:hypothetical protein